MELEILYAIQSIASPVLDVLIEAVTMFGEAFICIAVVSFVYWSVSKERGEAMALTILTSLVFNDILKGIFMRPRPIGEPGIRSLRVETATGSSFPSGHTQNAAATYASLAAAFGKRWLWVIAGVIIAGVAFSRLYLGVHWPTDVLAGAALGIGLALVIHKLSYYNVYDKHSAFGIIAIAAVLVALITGQEDAATTAGLAVGAAFGVRIEHRYICMTSNRTLGRRIARYILGMAVVAGVYLGLSALFPDGNVWRFLRYMLVAGTMIVGCPWIFVKIKL